MKVNSLRNHLLIVHIFCTVPLSVLCIVQSLAVLLPWPALDALLYLENGKISFNRNDYRI